MKSDSEDFLLPTDISLRPGAGGNEDRKQEADVLTGWEETCLSMSMLQNTKKDCSENQPLLLPLPLFVSHDLYRAEVVALVASSQLTVGVCSPGIQQPLICLRQAVAVAWYNLENRGNARVSSESSIETSTCWHITSQHDIRFFRFRSYLLNAQPLECSEAARRQLVSVVTDTQLSITIVAPAKNLDEHKTILFTVWCSDFSLGPLRFHVMSSSPLRSRPEPWRRSVHTRCQLQSCSAGSRWLSWGRAGWLWSLSQSGHSYYNPMQRPGGGWRQVRTRDAARKVVAWGKPNFSELLYDGWILMAFQLKYNMK